MHLSEVDWEINGNHYRVRVPTTSGGFARAMAGATNVETEWVYVPDEAVIDEPNRANVTLVWPLYGPMGVSVRPASKVMSGIPLAITRPPAARIAGPASSA